MQEVAHFGAAGGGCLREVGGGGEGEVGWGGHGWWIVVVFVVGGG